MDETHRIDDVYDSPVERVSESGRSAYGPSAVRGPPRSPTMNSLIRDEIIAPKSRQGTNLTVTSNASSVLEYPWTKQYILSFDGGGIRGYSSLLIVRELMDKIADEEEAVLGPDGKPAPADSSFKPSDPVYREQDPQIVPPGIDNAGLFRVLWRKARKQEDGTASHRNSGLTASRRQSAAQMSEKGDDSEKARRRRSNYLPCHYFDYVGGTSTGGLISILLGRLRISVDDAIEEYETLAGEIFGHPRIASIRPSWRGPILWPRDKYNGQRIVNVVNDVVTRRLGVKPTDIGQNLLSSHPHMCKTLVVSYQQRKVEDAGDSSAEPAYLFRSYDHHPCRPKKAWQRNPGFAHRVPIWQVARATSAAPTYFDSITIENRKFADGAFGTNNPTDEIYHEVRLMNGDEPSHVAIVISIGTGLNPIHRFSDKVFGKFLQVIGALKKLATDCERVHEQMAKLKEPGGMKYYRFNVDNEVLRKIRLDEWKAPNWHRKENITLKNITQVTEEYIKLPEVQDNLKDVAKRLVKNRRDRCNTLTWGLAATGKLWRCQFGGCSSQKSQKMRVSQKNLESHLRKAHLIYDQEELMKYVALGEESL
ncbi:MAG: hypothetical protein M4579_000208 [Chaenotheca gracillima]|nr:MAG: hypothetical protein M4579_000208 [Chaenotheca gracillima]